MRSPLRPAGLTALLATLFVAGCSSSSPGPTTTESPPSNSRQAELYSAAATAYNSGAGAIASSESTYCDQAKPTADLARCQTALSQDRDASLAFDRALRDITFTGQSTADAATLLADDASLEQLLQQAAMAPSLGVINAMTRQILDALKKAADDSSALRDDLGLPAATPG